MLILNHSEMWSMLPKIGINPLSGEGCRMGTRMDTDVSPDTAPFVEEYFAMKLHHPGFNGWAKKPGINWVEGRSFAYHYVDDKYVKKEGWITDDGYAFKLAHSVIPELFCFVALKMELADTIVMAIARLPKYDGLHFADQYLLMSSLEGKEFSNRLFELHDKSNLPDFTRRDGPSDMAVFFTRYSKAYQLRTFHAQHAGANRHAFTGKKIA